ncbi:MAG: hypothetical protein RIS02_1317 [Pseudomonadota bacterium]
MLTQRLMWIVWPAFLVAGLLELVMFDPDDMHWFGQEMTLSRQGVYTVSFFVFWALTIVSSSLTTLLSMSPFEVNRCPVAVDQRPPNCTQGSKDGSGCC